MLNGILLATAGTCGPLLTGGISSRLPAVVGPRLRTQRRAQGWDVATYGIGGTVGPSLVVALSGWASPTAAALALGAVAATAAGVLLLQFTTRPILATELRSSSREQPSG
ncbi:hypothetical protein ACFWVB_37005 [Streptomyces microflavus]|uniref:hypothetical protein n=1 Tax=Streptomyces microflavus TaxID=1919 RepID=UPI003663F3E9